MWITFYFCPTTDEDVLMRTTNNLELQENSGSSSALVLRIKDSNCTRLQLLDGNYRELVNVRIGREFVSGLLEDERTIGYFRKSHLRSIEFVTLAISDLQPVINTRASMGEDMAKHSFPALVRIRYAEAGPEYQSVQALGVARGFLVTDYYLNPVIPLAAIAALEISCA